MDTQSPILWKCDSQTDAPTLRFAGMREPIARDLAANASYVASKASIWAQLAKGQPRGGRPASYSLRGYRRTFYDNNKATESPQRPVGANATNFRAPRIAAFFGDVGYLISARALRTWYGAQFVNMPSFNIGIAYIRTYLNYWV